MIDNKNLILAIVLSVSILVGFEYFFKLTNPTPPPDPNAPEMQLGEKRVQAKKDTNIPNAPATPRPGQSVTQGVIPAAPGAPTASGQKTRKNALSGIQRVKIDAPRLHGSISLKGGLIDDLTLADYRETLDPKSAEIVLLSPKGIDKAYYAQFGWVPKDGVVVPTAETLWTASRKTLTPKNPVTLRWDNGQGLVFKRTISLDDNYMFTIHQAVENKSQKPQSMFSFGLVSRRGTPVTTGFYILHEGLLGVFDETLAEVDYDDLQEDGQVKKTSTGGWIGITDKYWLTALIPDQTNKTASRFLHQKRGGTSMYQVDFVGPEMTVQPGQSIAAESHLFSGAKEVRLLDGYEEKLGVKRFDLAIDFGWFYFLTKPLFYALLWINDRVLNLGVGILLLTVCIKLLFFPLANKSYKSMSKMKLLQPKMTKIRERHGDDKMAMNQAMMELYKKEQVNPASGCLPILVQIPVFFALYKVLFVTIEMRHAPFFGWIKDLSAPDPLSVFTLFGAIPWTPPDFLMIGIWPIIMGITMYLQQRLNPQPADPVQAKIFLFLPLFFTFLLARFPAGLVIYWAWNNLLSMCQQWVIMRRMGISGKDALK